LVDAATVMGRPTRLADNRVNATMNNSNIRPPDGFPLRRQLTDYPHVPMMLSIPFEPREVLAAIHKSAGSPETSETDRQIESLCNEYLAATEEHRVKLRQVATNGWSLLHYADRMAIRAMRTKDPGWIRLGLTSLVLESARSDPRETIMCLATLYHAALYIGADFGHLSDEAARTATPGIAHYIQQFVGREASQKSLSAFGLRITQDSDGPRIDFNPPRRRTKDKGE
jgi:hypothetical protein